MSTNAQSATKVKTITILSDIASVGIKATGVFLAFTFAAAIVSLGVYGEVASFLAPLVLAPVSAFVVTVVAGVAALLMEESITE